MNKADLIDAVAAAAGLSKTDSASSVEAVLGSITSALQRG
ncbi:MAG TPA: DNA-binding protein HU, partial [Gammaproteobacteria bacterium]|nr:DNA-binding protein HU [Gammaproteobacteria bacterium]